MRAIEPTSAGQLTIEGFSVGYEAFGDPANPAVLLLPSWQIVHSRAWKMQVPFLARSRRVVTFDPPGNGGGERTTDPAAFEYERIVCQAIGVLDALDIAQAAVLGYGRGCDYGLLLAATAPERVERLMLIGNGVTRAGWQPKPDPGFWDRRPTYEGWQKRNAHYFLEQYDDWLTFFVGELHPEPHSTKATEDMIGWGRETSPEMLVRTVPNGDLLPRLPAAEAIASIRCPVMLLHGGDDRCDPIEASYDLLDARPDWQMVVMEDCGLDVLGRHSVQVNREVEAFLHRASPAGQRTRTSDARD
ncbi:MAG TPA: alpha/beta hydrolase [Thermomicrobiales bacterium]|nr:alpha/beta hydrolase [Thermomicrobiales bacterium]